MSQTTVSLPAHLRSVLEPLPDILPSDLSAQLSPYLVQTASEIPHLVLSNIAKWARTDAARTQLCARNLEPSHYSIISLLAGTITSPSSKLPPYIPPDDAATVSKRAAEDRRAIAAILNALLSIGGAGYAAWWASNHTGWRDEWRVLFAFFVALALAFSESILYLIWQSRRDASRHRRARRQVQRAAKDDDSDHDLKKNKYLDENASGGLRRRKFRNLND